MEGLDQRGRTPNCPRPRKTVAYDDRHEPSSAMAAGLRVSGHAANLLFCASVLSAAVVRNSGAAALVQVRSLLLHTGSGGIVISPNGGRYGCRKGTEGDRRRLFAPTYSAGKKRTIVSAVGASSSSSPSSAAPPEQIITVCGKPKNTARQFFLSMMHMKQRNV